MRLVRYSRRNHGRRHIDFKHLARDFYGPPQFWAVNSRRMGQRVPGGWPGTLVWRPGLTGLRSASTRLHLNERAADAADRRIAVSCWKRTTLSACGCS
jgi:hypothetical protein